VRRTDIPPTKSNLLRLKEHFGFVRSGHELLDEKRQILLEELIDVHREARQLRAQLEGELAGLYHTLQEALLAGDRVPLEMQALAPSGSQTLRVRERSVMGVIVPLLEVETAEAPEPVVAPGWASPGAAAVRLRVRAMLERLVHLTETEVSCRRLAAELQKTQRKVNALEHVFIPEYRDTIHFIEDALEEREREALFHLKRLKARHVEDEEER
jgi:V/A-type H+/Na+-transporting ATPase subunit D